jgi:hypothetical protein
MTKKCAISLIILDQIERCLLDLDNDAALKLLKELHIILEKEEKQK